MIAFIALCHNAHLSKLVFFSDCYLENENKYATWRESYAFFRVKKGKNASQYKN